MNQAWRLLFIIRGVHFVKTNIILYLKYLYFRCALSYFNCNTEFIGSIIQYKLFQLVLVHSYHSQVLILIDGNKTVNWLYLVCPRLIRAVLNNSAIKTKMISLIKRTQQVWGSPKQGKHFSIPTQISRF